MYCNIIIYIYIYTLVFAGAEGLYQSYITVGTYKANYKCHATCATPIYLIYRCYNIIMLPLYYMRFICKINVQYKMTQTSRQVIIILLLQQRSRVISVVVCWHTQFFFQDLYKRNSNSKRNVSYVTL